MCTFLSPLKAWGRFPLELRDVFERFRGIVGFVGLSRALQNWED